MPPETAQDDGAGSGNLAEDVGRGRDQRESGIVCVGHLSEVHADPAARAAAPLGLLELPLARPRDAGEEALGPELTPRPLPAAAEDEPKDRVRDGGPRGECPGGSVPRSGSPGSCPTWP